MKKIVLTGGGTAGHVTPNIALLPKLKENGFEISYIGSYTGMEKQLIEEALTSCGSLRKAAKKLNLNPSTVSRKIKLYNILPPPDEIVMITHRSQHSQQ